MYTDEGACSQHTAEWETSAGVLNLWVAAPTRAKRPFTEATYQVSWIWDIYIMTYN